MKVRCPQCHTPIDVPRDSSLSDLACPTCGSIFSLIDEDETAPFDSATNKHPTGLILSVFIHLVESAHMYKFVEEQSNSGLVDYVLCQRALELIGLTLDDKQPLKRYDPLGKGHLEITEFIARGRAEKMQAFDQHLLDLLRANKIAVETALNAASNRTDFQTKLEMEGDFSDATEVDKKPDVPFEIEPDGRF